MGLYKCYAQNVLGSDVVQAFLYPVSIAQISQKQVRVDPPRITPMTLPASAEFWQRWHRSMAAVTRRHRQHLPPAPGLRQTSCASLPLSIDGTDKQTDGHGTVT